MTRSRFVLVPLILAAVAALAAGCGGGGAGGGVPADAVAVVGGTPISKTDFNQLIAAVQGQDKAKNTPFPKVGTSAYDTLRQQAVLYLVQYVELQQEGAKRGVTVTQADIDTDLKNLAKQYYGGDEKKLETAITSSGLTLPQARQQLAISLLQTKLESKVTSSLKVTEAAEKAYYTQNKASFTTPAETTRDVRHILVSSKAKAEMIEKMLKNGANFATLAKKYSTDTSSAVKGGSLGTISKGEMVAPFDKVAFSIKTNVISPPVHSQYGWHIIEATSPIVHKKAGVTPFSKAKAQIASQLLGTQKQTAWGNFLSQVSKDYKGKVTYQTGYAPPATTTDTTATTAP